MTDTTLLCWGCNSNGLLSTGPVKCLTTPQQCMISKCIVAIAASYKHVSFITDTGYVYSYGMNLDGRLGTGDKPDFKCTYVNPVKVHLPATAIRIKCGFSHVCTVLTTGYAYSWGFGDYGSLGTGEFRSKNLPGKVAITRYIKEFSCGAMHSGFVDSEGAVYMCGSNYYGELGVNRPEKIATPALVNFSQRVKRVECGVFYTLLLTNRGQVYGMGNNKYGQLGIGHKVNECHPTLIRELEGITNIAAGYHSGAIDSLGYLHLWGSGTFGELLRPKRFSLGFNVHELHIHGFFGLAISQSEHRIAIWGNNTSGYLGTGNVYPSKDPLEMQQLTGIALTTITCGPSFVVAVKQDNPRYYMLQNTTLPYNVTSYKATIESLAFPSHYSDLAEGARRLYDIDYYRRTQKTMALVDTDPDLRMKLSDVNYRRLAGTGRTSAAYDDNSNRIRGRQRGRNYLGDKERSQERVDEQKKREQQDELSTYKGRHDSRKVSNNSRFETNSPMQMKAYSYLSADKGGNSGAQQSPILNRSRKNYEGLFSTLLADYEILQTKYNVLELQLQMKLYKQGYQHYKAQRDVAEESKTIAYTNNSLQETNNKLCEYNKYIRMYASLLRKELTTCHNELRLTITKIDELYAAFVAKNNELSAVRMKQFSNDNELSNYYHRILNEKERCIYYLVNEHYKKQSEMMETIKRFYNDVIKVDLLNQSITTERNQLYDKLREAYDKIVELEEAYDRYIKQNSKNKQKFQYIQYLNEIRATELKSKMEDEQAVRKQVEKYWELAKLQMNKYIENVRKDTERYIEQFKLRKYKYIEVTRKDLYRQIQQIKTQMAKYIELADKDSYRRIDQAKIQAMKYTYVIRKDSEREIELVKLQSAKYIEHVKVLAEKYCSVSTQQLQRTEIDAKRLVSQLYNENKQLLKAIEYMKYFQAKEIKVAEQKIIEISKKLYAVEESLKQRGVELAYEKEYNAKCEQTINYLNEAKDKALDNLENHKNQLQLEKYKRRYLYIELKDKNKQIESLRQYNSIQYYYHKHYQKEIEDILLHKEYIIRKLRAYIDNVKRLALEYTREYQRIVYYLKNYITLKIKYFVGLKKYYDKNIVELYRHHEVVDKLYRKLSLKIEECYKYIKDHQTTSEVFANLRREHAKFKAEYQDMSLRVEAAISIETNLQNKLLEKSNNIRQLDQYKAELEREKEDLHKQIEEIKKYLYSSFDALLKSEKVTDELINANKEFALNEDHFTTKISELYRKIAYLEDYNRSYSPRYYALVKHNKYLDDRNRYLAQMVNKAIELQASSYKKSILKEVEISNEQILDQIREERTYSSKNRRPEIIKEDHAVNSSAVPSVRAVQYYPFTKLVDDKISTHKKKVSESAQRLASLLSIKEDYRSNIKSFSKSMNLRRNEDYELINRQMESLSQQKSRFMEKISGFAERLKIL